jgi:hypothetical protein
MIRTLKDELADWADFDVAGLYVGRCLGVFAPDITSVTQIKHVFWSAHPVGETITKFLRQLVEAGVLEYDDEHLRFRWNQAFRGSWQT